MPRLGIAGQLSSMIKKLKAQRKKHADALRAVDSIFESIGITTHLAAEEAPRRGRPPGRRGRKPGRPAGSRNTTSAMRPARAGRRGRGKFGTTGTESVMAFVKEAGTSGRTTAEINKQWKSEGRSGEAYITIGQLVKARKLKRKNLPGERGSRYTASGGA